MRHRFNQIKSFFFHTHRKKTWLALAVFTLWFWFCLPNPLFNDPSSMVLEDREGNLLGARIAGDGQWRFPKSDTLPEKYVQCLVGFEDREFYFHPGVNPFALGRAMIQNVGNQRVVSGGSTITMQVIRMARKNKPRHLGNKIIEAFMSLRLEMTYSKKEILALYAANAPLGGNVVGLEAASWRYFGKSPNQLSWAEAATMAVLPNAPSMIHVSRNRPALVAKRNRLLDGLILRGVLEKTTGELAKEEPLPEQPLPLPQSAPHLLDRAYFENIFKTGKSPRVRTTVDANLQIQVNKTLQIHHNSLIANGIHNAAVLVLDIETGEVLAYGGNVIGAGKEHGEDVDIIKSLRSTGSVLKPFLYAYAQQEGEILPNSLLLDIPTEIGGYHPENFAETYDGVIPARRALARSLNIPYVRLLNQYGIEKFYHHLKKVGISTFTKSPDHYGLTMILGGGEGTLWEITNAYTCMARTAKHWYTYQNKYSKNDWHSASYIFDKNKIRTQNSKPKTLSNDRQAQNLEETPSVFNASAAWLALDAMKEVERPDAEGNWELFDNARTIAWKTGTSFGFRDAWAVGVNSRYAVGVWVGNADGEGRPGLIGVEKAAPILFDIFNVLPNNSEWFYQPYDDMMQIEVCKKSGYRASDMCEKDTVWACKNGIKVRQCPYHKLVNLDKTEKHQVTSACEEPFNMVHKSWFLLPPLEEYYYRPKHPDYILPPQYRADCKRSEDKVNPMQMIYPKSLTKIYVPIDFNGQSSNVVFRVAHRQNDAIVYWHLDNDYIGQTKSFHQMSLNPAIGKHRLTLIDEGGNRLEQMFERIDKK
jgi:penicillin-binding protein 1C